MKIITINVPEQAIKGLEKLSTSRAEGGYGLYPSRSEAVRVALKNFLLEELKALKQPSKLFQPIKEDISDGVPSTSEESEESFVEIEGEKYKIKSRKEVLSKGGN